MKIVKTFFSITGKVLLVILILLALLFTGLTIHYFLTKQTAEDYLPRDFLVLVKIDSMKAIYDNLIDLKAAEILLSSREYQNLYKALLDFKSQSFSKSFFFRWILNIKADIVLDNALSPVIVLDPGFKSIVTQFFPLFSPFIQGETIKTVKEGKVTLFRVETSPGNFLYFALDKNLIFAALDPGHILDLYQNRATGDNLRGLGELATLRGNIDREGLLEAYVGTNQFLQEAAKHNDMLLSLSREFSFSSKSALSFSISNDDIKLDVYSQISTSNKELNNFLSYKAGSLGIIKYLPDNVGLFASVNFASFEELYNILTHFQNQQGGQGQLEKYNSQTKALLGLSTNELFFSWPGTEAGMYTIDTNSDPVLFLRIADKKQMDYVLKKIANSFFLDTDTSLVLDNVRIAKIAFPGIIKAFVDSFVPGIETPYYVSEGDYIFFCMNPENLSNLINKYKKNERLIRTPSYNAIARKTPKNANLFFYYDLNTTTPRFLANNSLISQLLRLYQKGLLSVYYTNKAVKVSVFAMGATSGQATLFPGFPKPLDEGLSSNVFCADLSGSAVKELIYITGKDDLVIADINNNVLYRAPVDKNSDLLVLPAKRKEESSIWVFSGNGTVYKFNGQAESASPFPLITSFAGSFTPTVYQDQLIFFSRSDKELVALAYNGDQKPYPFTITKDLLSAPVFYKNLIAYYPKSILGTVYLRDLEGNIQEGWPRNGGGISYGGPRFLMLAGDPALLFLTQKGSVNLWNLKGADVNHFPVDLPGVFYADPAVVNRKDQQAVLVLNKEGDLTLLDLTGRIISSRELKELASKETNIEPFDVDNNGIDEIFIYGGSNNIYGYDSDLRKLPGFPVKGSTKPVFTDINSDGILEMIAGSFDKHLYAYTLK